MGAWSGRQLAGLGGVASAILFLVSFLLPGKPPKFADNPLQVVAFFHDHHNKVLVGTVLGEIAVVLLIVVIAHVALHLRAAGQPPLAAVFLVSGTATAGILGVGIGIFGALGQLTVGGLVSAGAVQPLYKLLQFIQIPWYWATCAGVVCIGMAASRGVYPRVVMMLNAALAVLLVLGGVSVKATGAFAAGTGAFAMVASFVGVVFTLELGALLWMRAPEHAPAPAHAPV
ncbi:MAG: hypothetical protein JO017_06555 [Actinobacteria bacterium]|nr:hypothetical protein [Actinomycetota bacterium]